MNFHNIRMPQFIESFTVGRAEFATSCVSTLSGREIRSLDREYSKQRYWLKNCRLSSREFNHFSSFFRARRGSNFSFRLRDNGDYQVFNQFIARGDGRLKQFQLVKIYEDLIMPYSRIISKPAEGSCNLFIDKVKIVAQIDYHSGIVTLEKPLEEGQIIEASYLFDVEVRFASDSFEYYHTADGSIKLSEIELLEVI